MSSIDLSHVTPKTKLGFICLAFALLALLVIGAIWDLFAGDRKLPFTPR